MIHFVETTSSCYTLNVSFEINIINVSVRSVDVCNNIQTFFPDKWYMTSFKQVTCCWTYW